MPEQHEKIEGYRKLSDHEIELMNKVKAKGNELAEIIKEIDQLRGSQLRVYQHSTKAPEHVDGLTRKQLIESGRCINRSEDYLKTGVMWLVRSIALPDSF